MLKKQRAKSSKVACLIFGVLIILTVSMIYADHDGTRDNLKKAQTIQQLVNLVAKAEPGAEIVLADGIYDNVKATLRGKGTENNFIVIRPETPGGVIFTKQTALVLQGEYIRFRDFQFDRCRHPKSVGVLFLSGAIHCEISGCYFYQCGATNSPFQKVVELADKSQSNRICYNRFEGSLGMSIGVRIRNDSLNLQNLYNRFDHNQFINILPVGTLYNGAVNGMEAIQIGQSGIENRNYSIVEYNYFQNVTGDGAEIISNKASNNIYQYNTFRDCQSGLTLRFGHDCLVSGNFFFTTKAGIRLYGSNHIITNNYLFNIRTQAINLGCGDSTATKMYQQVSKALIANNTIVNAGEGITIGGTYNLSKGYTLYPDQVNIVNNLISTNRGVAVMRYGGVNLLFSNNIVYEPSPARPGESDPGILAADPKLSLQDYLMRPEKDSIVVDRGMFISQVAEDIDGQKRVGRYDVGADEASDDPILHRPVTASDTGPQWRK